MVLAELNAFVSRPIAPTRRIALGDVDLDCDAPPGAGGVLLAAIIAKYSRHLDDETYSNLGALLQRIAADQHVPQPMMRHRFQTDRVGLQHITYRLSSDDGGLRLRFPVEDATPAQHVLVATYGAATIDPTLRGDVIAFMERGLTYSGSDAELLRFLDGGWFSGGHLALGDPVRWALHVLSLDKGAAGASAAHRGHGRGSRQGPVPTTVDPAGRPGDPVTRELPGGLPHLPNRSEVQRAFRRQLRLTHPDHGGDSSGAAGRIADLTEARRILLER